jgi:magnesium-transporting ATPase (P-type)
MFTGIMGLMEQNDKTESEAWHHRSVQEVLHHLQTTADGLQQQEATERLDQHGLNRLASEQKQSGWQRLLRQFKNVLIHILLAAAVLTASLGEWLDTTVILAVILINAVIGFIQEGKAEHALESIRGMLSPKAKVIRDGEQHEIGAEEVAPGDIVVAGSGDRIPADVRIIESRNAQIDEATLTGESEPVNKQSDPVEADAALGDRKCMAYSSTIMTSGQIKGVVVATGRNTQIGRIGEMISGVEQICTPLLRKIDSFGKKLSIAIVLLSAALFVYGITFRDFGIGDMLMIVVGLGVAAIPQGLPAIMTITLALGVQRMAKHNAIIRKLPAVETLGAVTAIFSDKTGTLTRNEMTVATVALADHTYSVSGSGYKPEGEFRLDEEKVNVDELPVFLELARAGMLSSDAKLKNESGQWVLEGKPTEGAAVVLACKAGLKREEQQAQYPRIDVIPFESERRFMATLHKHGEDYVAYIKGAPERLLEMCSVQRRQDGDIPIDRESWIRREELLADSGHRVLAIASKTLKKDESFDENKLTEATLLGLIGIIDPPREEAIEAVGKCQQAGINVKMVTGDHALTARSIGQSMGIGDGEHVITGNDIDSIRSENQLAETIEQNDVFARSSPEHKLRMIQSLQSKGHVVAMTGDGVNDAPALKRSDVGVAMGIKGSEAAKRAAEIVLADDNFATIERAVEEGRTIYNNLVKTILFILPTNGAESLMVIASAVILFEVMPITPLQILWVNMVTAVTLAISLAFEPAEEDVMYKPPRPPAKPILSAYLVWRIIFVSIIIAAASILFFVYQQHAGVSLQQARTAAVNTLVAGQLFYLFNTRFINASSLHWRKLFNNRAALIAAAVLILLQLAFTYIGPVQRLFGTDAIGAVDWGIAGLAGLSVFFLVELEKWLLRRHSRSSGK